MNGELEKNRFKKGEFRIAIQTKISTKLSRKGKKGRKTEEEIN